MKEISQHLKNYIKVMNIIQNRDNIFDEQKSLNKDERMFKSIDKFILLENDINSDAKILLVDDVTTTGSTIMSAIHLLKLHGFKNINAFTFYLQF